MTERNEIPRTLFLNVKIEDGGMGDGHEKETVITVESATDDVIDCVTFEDYDDSTGRAVLSFTIRGLLQNAEFFGEVQRYLKESRDRWT